MPAEVTVLVGPARSGKTHWFVMQYRKALRAGSAGKVARALWLSPSSRGVAAVRQQLLADDLSAVLDPGIVTFDQLAGRVFAALPRPPQVLTSVLERELLRRVVEQIRASNGLKLLDVAAERSSFIELLVDVFSELTRHGIAAAAFAKSIGARGDRAQHEELSRLYTEYERLLKSHHLCDGEGRHVVVRDALRSDGFSLLTNLQLVVADGFADFTCIQHEILAGLARRSACLIVSLPGDESLIGAETPRSTNGRADLFAKSVATLAELRRRHSQLTVEQLPPRPTAWPALDHLADNIFRPPRDVSKPSREAIESLDRLEVVAAAGAQNEIVQIARRIKQRLVDGSARPNDLVVVFRSLHESASRVREVFGEFGIPYSLESSERLVSAGPIRTLLDLLRLDSENWPFRRLLAVVTNNVLSVFDRRARASSEWLIRDLQIADGRQTLLARVEQLASLPEANSADDTSRNKDKSSDMTSPDVKSETDRRRNRTSAAVAALGMLSQIAEGLDHLPERATPTEWISEFERLGTRLGIRQFSNPDVALPEDRLAWQRVAGHFTAVERLATTLGQAPQLARADALHLLVDIASHESLPRPHDDAGRVRVLAASTARGVEAKHVFLAGMSEQSFPSPERIGRLYSESDYQCFQNVGDQRRAESPPRAVNRSQEEMLLFYEVLTRATERLTISYPGLDEKAQDLPPSSYVSELERLFDGAATIRRVGPQLAPISSESSPLCPSEWRVQAVERALQPEGDLSLLASLVREPATKRVAQSIDSALRMHAIRTNRDAFGAADGLLVSPAVRAQLARRFGPQHLWSPSQWEHYAGCPFKSLMGDVLQLEPLGELTLETDALRRGSLLHRVLADVHRELRNRDGDSATFSQRDPAVVAAAFERAVEAELGPTPRAGLDGALEELDRRQIAKWSQQYIEQHGEYDGAWQNLDQAPLPTYFEFRFGPPRAEEREAEDPRSTAEPFRLQLGDEEIRITGRIDRIDVGRAGGQTVFNVIDYKSGKRPTLTAEKMESGERLQPPLYVMAAQVLLFGDDKARPLWAGYWSMDKGMTTNAKYSLKCSAEGGKSADEWKMLQEIVVARIRQFVTDIRAGSFPVFSRDDQCTSYCQFSTVCRVAQVRSLGKQWMPDLNPEP